MIRSFELHGDEGLLMRLIQEPGAQAQLEVVITDLAKTAEGWIDQGLDEWIGTGERAAPRHTSPEHPEFFDRLKSYIEGQFDDMQVRVV